MTRHLVVRLTVRYSVLEIGKLDSQLSLGSSRASHPNCMINRTAPGELEETIRQLMLSEPLPLPHPLIPTLSLESGIGPVPHEITTRPEALREILA